MSTSTTSTTTSTATCGTETAIAPTYTAPCPRGCTVTSGGTTAPAHAKRIAGSGLDAMLQCPVCRTVYLLSKV